MTLCNADDTSQPVEHPQSALGNLQPELRLNHLVINNTPRTPPYDAMGSSPTWHQVIYEHHKGKAVQTLWWPSVLELRVLITLGSEALEGSKDLDYGLAPP
jgi:hypothetical protein